MPFHLLTNIPHSSHEGAQGRRDFDCRLGKRGRVQRYRLLWSRPESALHVLLRRRGHVQRHHDGPGHRHHAEHELQKVLEGRRPPPWRLPEEDAQRVRSDGVGLRLRKEEEEKEEKEGRREKGEELDESSWMLCLAHNNKLSNPFHNGAHSCASSNPSHLDGVKRCTLEKNLFVLEAKPGPPPVARVAKHYHARVPPCSPSSSCCWRQ